MSVSRTRARSTGCHCPTGPVERSDHGLRWPRSRSTSPRWDRPTSPSPVNWPTGGSATRSSRRPPARSSIRSLPAPTVRAARSTTSIGSSPWHWSSPTMTRPPSRPPAAVTPTATPSPSGRWARRPRTSTTTRSPARATATTSRRSAACGRRATVRAQQHACRSRSGWARTSSDRRRRSNNASWTTSAAA